MNMCTIMIAASALLLTACRREPPAAPSAAHAPMKQQSSPLAVEFASNRFHRAEQLAKRLTIDMPPEYAEIYRAALQPDWGAATAAFMRTAARVRFFDNRGGENLNSPLWPTVMETMDFFDVASKWQPALLREFVRRVYIEIPSNAVYFGGTDPGRYAIAAFQQAMGRGDVAIITQNGLADADYLQYLRMTVAPEFAIEIPSPTDFSRAYQLYLADRDARRNRGEPVEEVQINNGKVRLGGVASTMQVNGILSSMIFQQNSNQHVFCIEEGFVMPWMYPYLEPAGIIMRLQPHKVSITPGMVAADSNYWGELRTSLGPALADDPAAQMTFAKCRCAIAGLYEYHKMYAVAERAYREAIMLCPTSAEAYMRLCSLLMKLQRFDESLRLAEEFRAKVPPDMRVDQMIDMIKSARDQAAKMPVKAPWAPRKP